MAHIGGTTRGDFAYFNTEIMGDMIFLGMKIRYYYIDSGI